MAHSSARFSALCINFIFRQPPRPACTPHLWSCHPPPATRHWLLFIFCAFCILFLLFIYECVCAGVQLYVINLRGSYCSSWRCFRRKSVSSWGRGRGRAGVWGLGAGVRSFVYEIKITPMRCPRKPFLPPIPPSADFFCSFQGKNGRPAGTGIPLGQAEQRRSKKNHRTAGQADWRTSGQADSRPSGWPVGQKIKNTASKYNNCKLSCCPFATESQTLPAA